LDPSISRFTFAKVIFIAKIGLNKQVLNTLGVNKNANEKKTKISEGKTKLKSGSGTFDCFKPV